MPALPGKYMPCLHCHNKNCAEGNINTLAVHGKILLRPCYADARVFSERKPQKEVFRLIAKQLL